MWFTSREKSSSLDRNLFTVGTSNSSEARKPFASSILATLQSIFTYFASPQQSSEPSPCLEHSESPRSSEPEPAWLGFVDSSPQWRRSLYHIERNIPKRERKQQILYVPHGRWEFVKDMQGINSMTIANITQNRIRSVVIAEGQFGDLVIPHIIKRWHHGVSNNRKGFFSELALYKAQQYLKPLQGDVVPHIIGVYATDEGLDVKMELPHSSFWIEASSKMPEVLKERCVQAYMKIHSRGVLHGSVELRHMLISPDANVSIVDFHRSRALDPKPEVGIAAAKPEEFEMELRKVMYKLDYRNARVTETLRYHKARRRREFNLASQRYTETYGVPTEEQPETEDEKNTPPPSDEEWTSSWAVNLDHQPKRFEMKDQTQDELEAAWKDFNELLYHLEGDYWVRMYKPMFRQTETKAEAEFRPAVKRKAIALPDDNPPNKRLRSSSPTPSTISEQSDSTIETAATTSSTTEDMSSTDCPSPSRSETLPLTEVAASGHLPTDPSPEFSSESESESESELSFTLSSAADSPPKMTAPEEDYPVPFVCVEHNSSSIEEIAEEDLPTVSCSSTSTSKEPKVRDYAYIPYDGPKGYYFPYPPMETRAALDRIISIRTQNAGRCVGEGLPYRFSDIRLMLGWSQTPPRGSDSTVALGNMKRKREEILALDTAERPKKKPRLEILDIPHDPSLGPDPAYGVGSTFLDLPGKRFLSKDEFLERQKPNKGKGPAAGKGKLKSILKPTKPVKTVSYAKEDWPDDPEAPLSPKLMPEKIAIRTTEFRAVMNSVVDPRIETSIFGRIGLKSMPATPMLPIVAGASHIAVPARDMTYDLIMAQKCKFGKMDRSAHADFETQSTRPKPRSFTMPSEQHQQQQRPNIPPRPNTMKNIMMKDPAFSWLFSRGPFGASGPGPSPSSSSSSRSGGESSNSADRFYHVRTPSSRSAGTSSDSTSKNYPKVNLSELDGMPVIDSAFEED
ncbi:unnamed protein product [Somion occarium]|uniref:Protein kinase domain-containing protein n=1 Tax=Somion occarium TaxID=3059160 RepID=A0ABP1CMP8_9APHY